MNLISVIGILLFASSCGLAATLGLAGNWTGESICTIKDSPCHDEKVIYHVTEPNAAGDLQIEADKIVNGKPESMGTLDCKYDEKASTITCSMKQGEWKFDVKGDTMIGTLTLPDGKLYRRVNLKKEH
jgi:hypothetical protein